MKAIIPEPSPVVHPNMHVVRVSPELAIDWLRRNTGNRPIAKANVKRLSSAIKSGKWKFTGDPIRFSKTGKLIDGQHRLQAIVDAGIPVSVAVIQGLDDEIFDVIDIGKGRSKSDVVFMKFQTSPARAIMLSSTANVAFQYEAGRYSLATYVENSELLDFIDANRDLIDAVNTVYDRSPHESPVAKSLVAAFYFYAARIDADLADQFVERFMVGVVTGPNDSLLYLRQLFMTARMHRKPYSKTLIFASLIKAWNAERRGRPFKHNSNIRLRSDEQYPRFI